MIQNETAHNEALACMERLWRAVRGTPDGDILDELIEMVILYDIEHHPIEVE